MCPKKINIREKMGKVVPRRWYATHHFDRYPAKMIPQLARFAIEKCTREGESVLDPFCGCGTVLVESRLAGRKATGIEINPYAVELARAKSYLYRETILKKMTDEVVNEAKIISKRARKENSWLNYWFADSTLQQLLGLRLAIERNADKVKPSYVSALRAVLGVTVRLVCKADPRSPKPFISERARRERCRKNFDAFEIFLNQGQKFLEAAKELRTLVKDGQDSHIRVINADARELEKNKKLGEFDAIISSPPYLTAQDYYRSSKLEISILGLMSKSELFGLGPATIGSGRGKTTYAILDKNDYFPKELRRLAKIDKRAAKTGVAFITDMQKVIKGCYEHLRSGGRCCFIIGDSKIRDVKLPVHKWIMKIALEQRLNLEEHFIDVIRSRRVPPQRQGHSSVIGYEHILIFSKE
jgi:DNA modification methylase